MKITQQTSSLKTWRDEQGMEIPFNRTSALERKKESQCI
jgi:hypothetical protein